MFYLILFLILAVLLFGSSAVLGALGMVLGFIVAFVALVYASITFDLEPIQIIGYAVVGVLALIPVGYLLLLVIDYFDPNAREHRKFAKDNAHILNSEYGKKLARMSSEELQSEVERTRLEYEKSQKEYEKLFGETNRD